MSVIKSSKVLGLVWTFIYLLFTLSSEVSGFQNIYGDELKQCSHDGMALTGFMRKGYCDSEPDDVLFHHICVDLSSVNLHPLNFCGTTGQSNWCDEPQLCHGSKEKNCEVKNWCVCQWAFAAYIENAGGCENIHDLVCEAINIEAYKTFKGILDSDEDLGDVSHIEVALNCIESRCDSSKIVK